MELLIKKIAEINNATLSALSAEGVFVCFVLEDGHRDVKVPGETRIPAGRYPIVARKRGKFYNLYKSRFGHTFVAEVWNVPGFSDILIHMGNSVTDTRGCVLVGLMATHDFRIANSESAYLMLYRIISAAFTRKEDVYLTIDRT